MSVSQQERNWREKRARLKIIRRAQQENARVKSADKAPKDESQFKTSDYGIAKIIAKIIAFFGWVALLVGFVVIGYGIAHSKGYENIDVILVIVLPGIGMVVTGLLMIVAGQITRATVDNANHNKHILFLLEKKLPKRK